MRGHGRSSCRARDRVVPDELSELAAEAKGYKAEGYLAMKLRFGWGPADDVIDVVAMLLTTPILGFHVLLLPTFVVELIPVAGMLPTWTGCVMAIALLRRAELAERAPGR